MAFQGANESGEHRRHSSWTCDSMTISYARCTNRCRRCKCLMAEGELRFGVIFKSHDQHMLFQGFHLCCVIPPSELTCPEELEGIQDVSPHHVETVRKWIQTGVAPPPARSIAQIVEVTQLPCMFNGSIASPESFVVSSMTCITRFLSYTISHEIHVETLMSAFRRRHNPD